MALVCILNKYLAETLGISPNSEGYQLLKCRQDGTAHEIEVLTKRKDLFLHPDKQQMVLWLQVHFPSLSSEDMVALLTMQMNFYQMWKDTKKNLQDKDHGLYIQAIPP